MLSQRLDDHSELRLLQPWHAEELFALVEANRPRLDYWLRTAIRFKTLEDTRKHVDEWLQRFATGEGIPLGIWHHGRLAGDIRLMRIDPRDRCGELAYWIGGAYEGKGLVTAACRAILAHAFADRQLHRVIIRAAVANTRSRAIPERLGFTLEGIQRESFYINGEYRDIASYSLLAREFSARD
ncbi:MAG: GCN5-related N-acetyltransferase [Cyanobacteria bacterium RYN_339]|nr:GCN5-related N-acetyltransferase [Cyanobacteria bacterium RYN_339]